MPKLPPAAAKSQAAAERRAARIALVPMEGLANYQAVLDSDVLWRYTTAEVALAAVEPVPSDSTRLVGDVSGFGDAEGVR